MQDLADKYGEDLSEDEGNSQPAKNVIIEKNELNDIDDADIDQMEDREILKEEDHSTDMTGFAQYQLLLYGEKYFTVET